LAQTAYVKHVEGTGNVMKKPDSVLHGVPRVFGKIGRDQNGLHELKKATEQK
jgi:hypothetical protein